MDPLAHALFGAALAKTRLGRRSPLSAAALVIGAVAPDLDAVAWLFGGADAWQRVRAGLTHSPIGLILLGLALVPFLRWFEREFWGRHSVFTAGGRPGTCAPAVLVGLATHLPIDLLTDHGARPGVPFGGGWVRADLVHPMDPWLWLLFGGAAALAGRRTPGGSAALALAALTGLGLIGAHPQSPGWLPWAYAGVCLALAWARAAGVGRRASTRTLLRAGGLGLLYLWLLIAARGDARASVAEALTERAPDAAVTGAHPRFGDPLAWTFLAVGERGSLRIRTRWRAEPEVSAVERRLQEPLVLTALRLPESATWRRVARDPAGDVTPAEGGGVWVELRDLAEEDRPWEPYLRWRHRFPPQEVERIHGMFEAAERAGR